MAESDNEDPDLEHANECIDGGDGGAVDLERLGSYMKRAKARIRLSRARAANIVAYMLVGGFVASLPLYVLSVALMNAEASERVVTVFTRWYDVVAPLVGAVIGGLFGMSTAGRQRGE